MLETQVKKLAPCNLGENVNNNCICLKNKRIERFEIYNIFRILPLKECPEIIYCEKKHKMPTQEEPQKDPFVPGKPDAIAGARG